MISREEALKDWGKKNVSCEDIVERIYDSIGSCEECSLYCTFKCEAIGSNKPNDWYCADFERKEKEDD